MAWTEAPASGESRRSTVIPHAFRHRVSSRLYLRGRSERRRFIPTTDIGRSTVDRPTGNPIVSAIWGTAAIFGVLRSTESAPADLVDRFLNQR
jgi:hypothetical protein